MKVINIVRYACSIIGILMLIGAAALYVKIERFRGEAIEAQGTVVALEERVSRNSDNGYSRTYAPRVRFMTANGEEVEFVDSLSSYPPSYTIKETVQVLYLPNQPHKAGIKGAGQYTGVLVLSLLGGVFFLVGAGISLVLWRKNRLNSWLQRHGRRVQAKIVNVGLDQSLMVNGRHPFQISAQWQNPSTTKLHVFESPNIWFDPSPYIKQETVSVLIDPHDPSRYLVDISFLPQLA